jgi:hypothetical protein
LKDCAETVLVTPIAKERIADDSLVIKLSVFLSPPSLGVRPM